MNAASMPGRYFVLLAVVFTALFASGCATPQATSVSNELPFDQAVAIATDGLVSQTQRLPGFLSQVVTQVESKLAKRGIVLDPMLDAGTGQQTEATKLLERSVTERIAAKFSALEILPFRNVNLAKAQYLLTGTMTRVQADRPKSPFRINLALTDLKSASVVAQAYAIARDDGLDTTPLPYYRDSPVLVKDKVVEGYIRTTATGPGQPADATYFERLSVATLIDEATTLYNAERYQDSLAQYRSALATAQGEQLRVLNGIYLTNMKLGRQADAEQAFGRVVTLGIAYNQLGVKFLFNPGGTEFWPDPKISGSYVMWLRQIARAATSAKVCMHVVGHTSHTGTESFNDALSLQRAAYVKQRLAGEEGELAAKTKAQGMGFSQNIVGSGTDNLVDALDRRVEFRIVPCG
jgi:outer membrane protein OmpA-like peptidoglycan-associated protein